MLSERKQYYLIHFSAPPEDKFLKVNQKLLTKPNQSRLKLRRGGDYVRESLFSEFSDSVYMDYVLDCVGNMESDSEMNKMK